MVEQGWVTLEGRVAADDLRNAAERAVRYLKGVHGVKNRIRVEPTAPARRQPAAARRTTADGGAVATRASRLAEAGAFTNPVAAGAAAGSRVDKGG